MKVFWIYAAIVIVGVGLFFGTFDKSAYQGIPTTGGGPAANAP